MKLYISKRCNDKCYDISVSYYCINLYIIIFRKYGRNNNKDDNLERDGKNELLYKFFYILYCTKY